MVRHWMWLILAAAVIVVVVTSGDYGPTWDEGIQAWYGESALAYFASGFKDASYLADPVMPRYGPLVEMIPAAIYGSNLAMKYDVRHLYLGLLSTLMIPAVALLGRRFGWPWMSLFAAIAVVMLPRLYGDWYSNSKDTPLAVAMAWHMVALAALCSDRRFQWRHVIGCGLAMGAALCARPGVFPLLAMFFVAAALLTWFRGPVGAAGAPRIRLSLWSLLSKIVVMVGMAWTLMVLPWPWAHQAPFTNPVDAMRTAAAFPNPLPVLFDGELLKSTDLPRYYMIQYLLITTPPTLLALAVAGLVFGVAGAVRDRRSRTTFMFGMTVIWLAAPLAAFTILRPNVYDGLRHFLFGLPALALLAALGAAGIIGLAGRRKLRAFAWPIVLLMLLLPLKDLIALHPYQTTYFNWFVGGLRGANDRYETDYWAASYREAVQWINARAAQSPQRRVVVLMAGGSALPPLAAHLKSSNVDLHAIDTAAGVRQLPPWADYYIGTTRCRLAYEDFTDAPIVHTIGRKGAVFTIIKSRSESPGPR